MFVRTYGCPFFKVYNQIHLNSLFSLYTNITFDHPRFTLPIGIRAYKVVIMTIRLSKRGCTSGPNGQQICNNISTQDRWTATGIGSGLGVFVALVGFILLLVYLERRKKRRSSPDLGDEEDGGIDPHRIDIDTTPQSYYAGEVEMRDGILVEGNTNSNKKDTFDINSSYLYPPPPATLAHNPPSSSSILSSTKPTPDSIPDPSFHRSDSGSSSIPPLPQAKTEALDIPPPAYVEKSSN